MIGRALPDKKPNAETACASLNLDKPQTHVERR